MNILKWLFGSKSKTEVEKKIQPVRKITMMGSSNRGSSYGVSRKYESSTNNGSNDLVTAMLLSNALDDNTPEPTKEFEGGFGGGHFSGGGAGGDFNESPSISNDYSSNDYSSPSDSTSYSSDSSSNDY